MTISCKQLCTCTLTLVHVYSYKLNSCTGFYCSHTECKEFFALFDHDGNDTISARDLGNVMRAMGHHPKEAEVAAIIADVDFESR